MKTSRKTKNFGIGLGALMFVLTLASCGQGLGPQGTLDISGGNGSLAGPPVECDASGGSISRPEGDWRLIISEGDQQRILVNITLTPSSAKFTLNCDMGNFRMASVPLVISADIGTSDINFLQQNPTTLSASSSGGLSCSAPSLAGPYLYGFSGNCLLLQQAGKSLYLTPQ